MDRHPAAPQPAVFALLDDSSAAPGDPARSRLYTGWVKEHRCTDPATLEGLWQAVQADQQHGLHALLLADYEWGAKLLGVGDADAEHGTPSPASLRVLMFSTLERLHPEQVDAWLAAQDQQQTPPSPAGCLALTPSVDEAAYRAAIATIHEAIAAGQTYQVNYSYRLDGLAFGSPLALFRRLRAHQPVPFAALLALPDGDGGPRHVLSLSPELLLRHEQGCVTARPMKGTAPRPARAEDDEAAAQALAHDTKNRAENLMIVDLLRNDLGRVAQIGSVRVPALFAVERYATVLQMTSTVQAMLRPGVEFPAVLRAVFPCGSITGAPKHQTMKLIAALETTRRGLYCGAIGWVDAAPAAAGASQATWPGDFCLSVAIRTLTLDAPRPGDGLRPLRLGVGGGIVQDSRAADEYRETQLKARFLTGLDPGVELFETLRADRHGGAFQVSTWPLHRARLGRSAAALGFVFDATQADALLDETLCALAASSAPGDGLAGDADHANPPGTLSWRLRLSLHANGQLALHRTPLLPLPGALPVWLIDHPEPLPWAQRPLAGHKTSWRGPYDAAIRAAEAQGAFDSLLYNPAGELLEGGRSTVFVQLGGRWWTPPLAAGVLPGVTRQQLLADPAWQAAERVIHRDELPAAQAWVVCNALRGVLPARHLRYQPGHQLPR